MADTRPDIALPANTQVDLYAALNAQAGFPAVTVGAAISVQNRGSNDIELTTKATTPVQGDGSTTLKPGKAASNVTPSNGEFAQSATINGLVNVRVL